MPLFVSSCSCSFSFELSTLSCSIVARCLRMVDCESSEYDRRLPSMMRYFRWISATCSSTSLLSPMWPIAVWRPLEYGEPRLCARGIVP